jgi:polyphosphate glucokinase
MKVLVIDVGGTHVKVLATGKRAHRQVESGPTMTAEQMVTAVKQLAEDWQYEAVSIGYPGPIVHDRPLHEPYNMGGGWVGFDFRQAFGCPVRLINDAAMQALGSYNAGRLLFLGLGTGLGSAMVVDVIVQPMELGHLPYRKGRTYEDYVGLRGMKRLGKKRWRQHVLVVIEKLQAALEPDNVVIGGGNAKRLTELPMGCRLGDNANAFVGGFKLWKEHAT